MRKAFCHHSVIISLQHYSTQSLMVHKDNSDISVRASSCAGLWPQQVLIHS